MNLHDLRYFVALAEEHHFGRAAASCGVSQPTLSTQIHRLENELGVVLAVRVGRRIEITPVGERIAQAARDMLVLSDDIRTMAREEADRMTLQLRVGVFPTLGPFVLPQVIARCDQHEPGVNIHIVEKRTAELLEAIRNGQLDVAAVAAPVNDDSLVTIPVFREEFLLVTGADDELAREERPINPHDVPTEGLILMSEGHCLRDQVLEVCSPSHPLPPDTLTAGSPRRSANSYRWAPVEPSCRAVRSRHHFMRTRASWCGSSPTPDPTATSWWLADRPQCTVRRCRP